MNRIAVTTIISVLSSFAYAAQDGHATDAVTRRSLEQWGWAGEWSNDCSGSGDRIVTYLNTLSQNGRHPTISVARNGKFVVEEVVTSASISRTDAHALELRVKQETSAGVTDIYRLIVRSGRSARVMQSDGVAVYNMDMPVSDAFPHSLKGGEKEHQTYVVNGNLTGPPGALKGPTHSISQCSR